MKTKAKRLTPWSGTRKQLAELAAFLEEMRRIRWFAHAGRKTSGAYVVRDISEAEHRVAGGSSNAIWSKNSHALERRARRRESDAWIDGVFARVGDALGAPIWDGLGNYLARMTRRNPRFDPIGAHSSSAIDAHDRIVSTLAWAAVERLLGIDDFFTGLLVWYRRGRWPCGWRGGQPPKGRVVLL